MRKTLAFTVALIALPAAASQSVTPALLPKLIGASVADIEREYGQPIKQCAVAQATVCNYRANETLRIFYRHGQAVEAVWFPPKGTKAVDIDALQLGGSCKTQEADPARGGDVMRGCPGQLTIDLGNLKSGELFSLTVRRER